VAAVDQSTRVDGLPRYDVADAAGGIGSRAGPGDVVVYGPDDIGDLVRASAPKTLVEPVSKAANAITTAARVHVIGAFGWREGDPAGGALLDLVRQLAAARPLLGQSGTEEVKVWDFG
jgi:hypothetical protein